MRPAILAFLLLSTLAAQVSPTPQQGGDDRPRNMRLPDGRNQMEEILKADHQKNVREIGELIRLAEEVQNELMKQDRHVLAIDNLKKLEQIEKMAKNLRSRIKK